MVYRTTKAAISYFKKLRFGALYFLRSNSNGPFVKVGRRHRLATNVLPTSNYAPTAVTDVSVAVQKVTRSQLTQGK